MEMMIIIVIRLPLLDYIPLNRSKSSGLSSGAIVGIILGSIAAIVIIIVLILLARKQVARTPAKNNETSKTDSHLNFKV